MPWPETRMLADAGYIDTCRLAHPDPTRDTPTRNDVSIHVRVRSGLALEAPQVDTLDPQLWPTDHRAVIVSVRMAAPRTAVFDKDGTVNRRIPLIFRPIPS